MRKPSTFFELNSIVSELKNFEQLDLPTVKSFCSSKIQKFYKVNNYNITLMQTKINSLYEKHVERNDEEEVAAKGKFKTQNQLVDINDTPTEVTLPVFIDNAHAGQFKLEWDEFLKRPCVIEI